MPKRQNLPALATVLIILTLVILPLTLTAASLVQEAANFHESMQGGSWNPGAFFQQVLAVLPSWSTGLLDRLGLKDLAAVQASYPRPSAKAACSLPPRRSIPGSAPSTSSSASLSCCLPALLLRAGRRGADTAHHACHSRCRASSSMPSWANRPPSSARPSRATCWWHGAGSSRRADLLVPGDQRAGAMGCGDGALLVAARGRRGHRLVSGGGLFPGDRVGLAGRCP